jgi:methylated-DNA-protein-cysteine methyltransferase related protein
MSEIPQSAYQKIYIIVRQIPLGKVATYGQIADLAGYYGKARLVGYALYQVDPASDIPWQRVINIKGEVSYSTAREGADYVQRNLLEQEGILFNAEGKIDLSEYRWQVAPDFFDDVFVDR